MIIEKEIYMNYDAFCKKVETSAAKILDGDAELSLMDVTKNNGLILKGLVVRFRDSRISPTIYLEQFYNMYESGMSFGNVMLRITECANSHAGIRFNADRYTDYESVRGSIVYKVVNYDMNASMLSSVPHLKWNDLAIIFCWMVDGDCDGYATVTVRNEHLEMWGVGCEDLYAEARRNTPVLMPETVDTMENILRDIRNKCHPDSAEDDDCVWPDGLSFVPAMYVLSNEKRLFGATSMLYSANMKLIADRYESDLYILPSSIHEVILLPAHESCDEDYMRSMIAEINRTQVDIEDRLSDSLYYYDRENNEINQK